MRVADEDTPRIRHDRRLEFRHIHNAMQRIWMAEVSRAGRLEPREVSSADDRTGFNRLRPTETRNSPYFAIISTVRWVLSG